MNDVVFNLGASGLGRPLPGEDHISGLLVYTSATLPTGFASNDRIKVVYSVAEAVALGNSVGGIVASGYSVDRYRTDWHGSAIGIEEHKQRCKKST